MCTRKHVEGSCKDRVTTSNAFVGISHDSVLGAEGLNLFANVLCALCRFFHFIFKVAALVAYKAMESFISEGSSFVLTFITVVTISAADFWTTKNVTGRLLVGLRWWNEVKPDGTDVWIFESLEDRTKINNKEFWWFWGVMVIFPILWAFFAFGAIFSILSFSPQWVLVCAIVLILYGANLLGFWKCAKDAKKRVKNYATQQASSYLASAIFSAMTNPNANKDAATNNV